MTIGKILAPLTGGTRDATVLASAFAAAKPFNAHVIALFVRPDPAQAMPFFGEGMSGPMVEEIVDVAKDAADKVRRWGDAVELEPMNAFDRRIVHQAIKDEPGLETHSVEVEGTEKKAILIRPKH